MTYLGRHAIVVGASMGGLLAARALADYYAEVTVLERDALGEACEPRKGVPQGRHAHGLLARGRVALEQLFPGLSEEMAARGAVYGDIVDEVRLFNYGVYLENAPSALLALLISRPMLESGVRRRLLRLPNIRLEEQCDVIDPTFDRTLGRVNGVRVRHRGSHNGAKTMSADLVVDASGRGSQAPGWLDALGYAPPREESIKVNIGYVTRHFRRRREHLEGKHAVVIAACRPDWRCGVILAQARGARGAAIQRALADLNARNAAIGAPQLSARIGLENGPVVVDLTGEVYGEPPNVAARVQSAAAPGENTPLLPIAEWGRARFGGAEAPGEKRLAELEAALGSVGLDDPSRRRSTGLMSCARRVRLRGGSHVILANARIQRATRLSR